MEDLDSLYINLVKVDTHTQRGGGGGGGGLCFFPEDKTSKLGVFSSCSFIPSAIFETTLVMVSCYDVISNRWLSQFGVKIHVFSTFFNN